MPADGYLNFDTKIDTDGFDDGLKDVNRHVNGFSSALGGLGRTIKTAFNTAVIAAFGKAVIDSAADVKAAGAQFEQTFGEMQDAAEAAIDRVAKPADIISERLRGSATSIYAFAKTAKMETSTAMTFMEDALRAAADSAAYYDKSIEDTTQTLQSFLKGNYENDAALGLSATEATRNAKAMQLYGKSFKNLSEAQKQITLLEMVKEANALSGATGQAAREADGWANVTGNLSEAWKQFLGVVGQPVLQLVVPVIQQITASLQQLTKPVDTSWVDAFIAKLQELKDFITNILKPAIEAIAEPFQTAFDKTKEYIDTVVKPKLDELSQKRTAEVEITMAGGEAEGNEESDEGEPNVDNPFAAIGEWIANDLPTMFQNVVNTMLNMLDPLAQWFNTDLPEFIRAGINFASTVISGLLDTFTTVFNDVWTLVIDPFFTTFAENILPVFTQLGTELFNTLTVAFEEVKKAFDMLWTDVINPVLEFIGQAWSDLWTLIQEKWEQWGEPIFNQLREAIKNTGDAFEGIWKNTLKPVWDQFMATIKMLWEKHLKPLFSNLLNFIGKLVKGALIIYNQVITPLVSWIQTYIGPIFQAVFGTIIDILGKFAALVIDKANSIILYFTDVIDFFTNVFQGNWEGAWEAIKNAVETTWEGMKTTFKGFVNLLIGFLNGLLTGFETTVNVIVSKINIMIESINTVLKTIGLPEITYRVPSVTLPRIPELAQGAVIPPNREFLAVLGDQKSGTNIETPLETMLEAFRTALRENGGGHGQQTIILTIDKRELGRVIVDAGSEEERRIGLRLVTT